MIFSYLCSAKVTKMKYKAIIFDLDGTLTDTLEDLFLSVNHALRSCSLPERSLDAVRKFVGNGVRKLIERSVPEGTQSTVLEKCFEAFRAHYVIHCQDHTCLYPGIATLLMTLHARGYRMAVVSNKLQTGVDELARTFFSGLLEYTVGESPSVRRKPAPDTVLTAAARMAVPVESCVYIGDSEVDLETARNAGMDCISVAWGFRDEPQLLEAGAVTLAHTPTELGALLLG